MTPPTTLDPPMTRDLTVRLATVRAATLDEKARSVDAVVSTNRVTQVLDMRRFQVIDEVLVQRGGEFPNKTPLLDSHMKTTTDDVHGSVTNFRQEGDTQTVATLTFARDDDAQKRFDKVRDGHLDSVSVGYRNLPGGFTDIEPGATKRVAGKEYTAGERTLRISTGWKPHEVSLVAIGADEGARIRAALESQAAVNGRTESNAMPDTIEKGADQTTETAAQDTETTPMTRREEPIDAESIRRQAMADERERISSIKELAGTDVGPDLVERAINENWTPDQAGTRFLKSIRTQRSEPVGRAPAGIVRSNGTDDTLEVLSAGVVLRAGLSPIDPKASDRKRARQEEIAERAERYSDLSLDDVVRECHRLEGRECPLNREERIRSGFSTSALTNVFTNVVGAQLLATYEQAPDSTNGWVREVDVADFKQQERTQLGKGKDLKLLPRGKGADHESRDDRMEPYKIHRFARIFQVDEQDVVDDAMNALLDFPREFGQAAARLRPDLVYSIIHANDTLNADGVALFAAGHSNTQTGALAQATLQTVIEEMAKQADTGVTLNLRPGYLIVPWDLFFTAKVLLRSQEIKGSTDEGTLNPLGDMGIQIRVDNRMGVAGVTDPVTGTVHTGTATNYVVAATQPNIEVGYLRGTNRRPSVRSFTLDQGKWGIGWDVKMDIGAKALDFRGLQFSTGA